MSTSPPPPAREPVVLSWSGGKDAAFALEELQASEHFRVVGLLTTVTAGLDRVSGHQQKRRLVEAQARAIGLPLAVVELSPGAPNREYEVRMAAALGQFRERGVLTVAYGDILLEDVRRYREALLRPLGLRALFPLWGRDTREHAHDLVRRGYRAVLTCVDTQSLHASFAGRAFDESLLAELPPSTDPCGEYGEFHTFVHAGPILPAPFPVIVGPRRLWEGRFACRELEG